MTPLGLKRLAVALGVLLTKREPNLIHAIGTQTPVVGIYPSVDDSIARHFFSLRAHLPMDASMLALPAGP